MHWKLLYIPDIGDDLPSCILEMAYENVQINFLYQAQNPIDFSDFSENFCAGMAIFAISKLLLTISPNIRCIRYL